MSFILCVANFKSILVIIIRFYFVYQKSLRTWVGPKKSKESMSRVKTFVQSDLRWESSLSSTPFLVDV